MVRTGELLELEKVRLRKNGSVPVRGEAAHHRVILHPGRWAVRKHILPYHGHKKIDEITSLDCENLLLEWSTKMANKSANNHKSTYSTMLGEYERRRKLADPRDVYYNPWKLIKQLGVKKNKTGGIPLDVAKAILDRSSVVQFRNRTLYFDVMKLAFYTGMRIGEICGLYTEDVQDVEIERDEKPIRYSYLEVKYQICDRTGKRELVKDKDARQIPISAEIREELDQYLTGPGRFVFSIHPRQETPVSQGAIRDWFYQHLINVGAVKDEAERKARRISFHSTRRFFNTLLRRDGVSDDLIRKFTGHDDDEMTEAYTDYLVEDMQTITAAQRKLGASE